MATGFASMGSAAHNEAFSPLGSENRVDRQLGVIRGRVDDRRRQPLDGFELQRLGSDGGNSSDEKDREAGQQNGRFHGFPEEV